MLLVLDPTRRCLVSACFLSCPTMAEPKWQWEHWRRSGPFVYTLSHPQLWPTPPQLLGSTRSERSP